MSHSHRNPERPFHQSPEVANALGSHNSKDRRTQHRCCYSPGLEHPPDELFRLNALIDYFICQRKCKPYKGQPGSDQSPKRRSYTRLSERA